MSKIKKMKKNKMDSKHIKLKKLVEYYYRVIKNANKELKKIRETECEHPKTEKVSYMWAPGHIHEDTEVCSICGEVIITMNGKMETFMEADTIEGITISSTDN